MPREPRLLLSQSYYHVMTRGNNKMSVFRADDDYQRYLDLMVRFKVDRPFDLFHYTLMPNHTHFLVRTKAAADFGVFMKQLELAYFHAFRKQYGWTGHLWQGRYKTQPVGKDAYFLQCGKYVELNALRAGLVDDPSDWRWTSYHYYASGRSDPLMTDDPFYDGLGALPEARQAAYQHLVIDDLVAQSYPLPMWGTARQRYAEREKVTRNIKRRIIR